MSFEILKVGSKNDNVKILQRKLGLNVDGDFGPKTEASVKAWQTKNGLNPTGEINLNDWEKLNENNFDFNLDNLVSYIPNSVISELKTIIEKFNITNKLRVAHFLAQCSHESGNFKAVSENLLYSKDGLKKVFGKYFPGNLSESYARNPEKIASRVYGNRMGNGDESTKEGYKFRGRGYIQLTGKNNYKNFSDFINEDCVSNPDLVASKYPLTSAAFFFNKNNLWSTCDLGHSDDVVKKVTKRVNGGTNGLSDRIKKFKIYYSIL